MNKLVNRKKELTKIIEKKENEIKAYEDVINYIDNILDKYSKSVRVGKIISISSGLLTSLLFFITEVLLFNVADFSLLSLDYIIPLVCISTIDIIPIIVGAKCFIDTSKNIEKEMNINVKELKNDRLCFDHLINYDKKDIDELIIKLDEMDYNLKESCIDYGAIDDDIIYDKEKVKVLKLNKKF